GRFVLYYDPDKRDYVSYEVATGRSMNVTRGAHARWTVRHDDHPDSASGSTSGALWGWTVNDSVAWVQSWYDVFAIDPTGKREPLNVTNGYGTRHHVVFDNAQARRFSDPNWITHDPVLVHFVFEDTKAEGFGLIQPGRSADPQVLSV